LNTQAAREETARLAALAAARAALPPEPIIDLEAQHVITIDLTDL
jgi:hypothetical protein